MDATADREISFNCTDAKFHGFPQNTSFMDT